MAGWKRWPENSVKVIEAIPLCMQVVGPAVGCHSGHTGHSTIVRLSLLLEVKGGVFGGLAGWVEVTVIQDLLVTGLQTDGRECLC